LDGLKPKGVLKQRVERMHKIAPGFFTKSKRFLDVGVNKGWFSLYASQFCEEVIGIDSNPKFIELCNELKKPNTEFVQTGFRNFTPNKTFDKIFLGNVHYKIYRECNGWDWLYKLASISTGQVLIEGPIDMNCQGITFKDKELEDHFNYEEFINIMNKFFILKKKEPTVSYTPNRYIMLFERKPNKINKKFELKDLPVLSTIVASSRGRIFITKDNLVCKTSKNFIFWKNKQRINIAGLSPVSNGLVGFVYEEGKCLGWMEKLLEGKFFGCFENEIELFKLHCMHQIFLLRNGYFDLDPATINFIKIDGKIVNFDKGATHPINILGLDNWDLEKGSYFKCLRQSYKKLGKDILLQISNAMKTKDSFEIEKAYKKILGELK
jgi:SAM-dependent methyltransferase